VQQRKPNRRARPSNDAHCYHLYGLINCGSLRSLELKGIDDAVVFCRPYRQIGAAVSKCRCHASPRDIDAVARHEKVIDRLMEQFSVLPARFATVLFSGEELDMLLADNYTSFCEDLERLENKVQFDVKVTWPAGEIRLAIEQSDHSLYLARCCAPSDAEEYRPPAARYALYKQRERAIQQFLRSRAAEYCDQIQATLVKIAAASRCEVLPQQELMLSGSYLVDRARRTQFREAIDLLQSEHADLSFILTGPWPPYSFMNIEQRVLTCQMV